MSGAQFPPRACPVCGGTERKALYQQRFQQLSGARLLDGYDVSVCQDCGAGFADGIPPQDVFDAYYRELSKYDDADHWNAAPPDAEQRFQDAARTIREHVPSAEARVLEIGSASGQLLRVLRDWGYRSLLGADPSPGCVLTAQARYGIPGIVGTVFDLAEPEIPYDFIILIGVMEHIRDLDRAVARLRALLSGGGRIYLEVPDASRYLARADAPFQEFSLEHINFFSRVSLANLMQTRGFRMIASGHAMRPQHEAACPSVWAVFEKSPEPGVITRDARTERGLRKYIEGCAQEDARICGLIGRALEPGQRMIVWGVGAHTLRLLATGGLNPARVVRFVDSNPKYQRQELCGVPVVAPREIRGRTEPILISSRGFQNEIRRQIQQDLQLKNPLILLYGES